MSGLEASISLGPYQSAVDAAVAEMKRNRVLERLFRKDYTLWKPSPAEIANRLGWLESPGIMAGHIERVHAFVKALRAEGYSRVLLFGMGGSSLAPEVFRKTFGVAEGYPDLTVLDSTDPAVIISLLREIDPAKTLFIVSTKSGGTVETFSFMKTFFNLLSEKFGAAEAGRHFAAITDPGSALAGLAAAHHFRETFLNDPDIGGRYSALSYFGIVPAALIGVDVRKLLAGAAERADKENAANDSEAGGLSGLYLGGVMAELARYGRDKLTLGFSPPMAAFGDWLEQLIAESTGKEGKGILPVVGESLGTPDVYGEDRFFVRLHLAEDQVAHETMEAFSRAGHPVLDITLRNSYDLGEQIFLWETATAIAGHLLGINPFDQPDVEAAKALARRMIDRCKELGTLPPEIPALDGDGMTVYGDIMGHSPGDALHIFLGKALPRGYIAIQAYLPPTTKTDRALRRLQTRLRDRYRLATTIGYGPRFLHSTGQLHKGDGNRGLFIQLTADDHQDVPIPEEMGRPGSSITFGTLKAAQALGDRHALLNAGRQVIRFHLGRDISGGLEVLTKALS